MYITVLFGGLKEYIVSFFFNNKFIYLITMLLQQLRSKTIKW
jgi:hypothetical protein